ncbi:MAG: hypothetical protein KGL37_11190 [Acidobacteriota bacterium]|nr:hypothetical protein [Acidobacteriota bacterium]
MNSTAQNPFPRDIESGSAEETLRLIASLPAPEGLEDRLRAGLSSRPRPGRVLAWPASLRPSGNWMRATAAAAIVFVVAGGGWGVYSHVQQGQSAKVIVLPLRTQAPGGFSSAGAMRTPRTLSGPVLNHPAEARPSQPKPSQKKPAQAARPIRRSPAVAGKAAGLPALPSSK